MVLSNIEKKSQVVADWAEALGLLALVLAQGKVTQGILVFLAEFLKGISPYLLDVWQKAFRDRNLPRVEFMPPNIEQLFLDFSQDEVLANTYQDLLAKKTKKNYQKLLPIWMDLTYGTSLDMLHEKYPELPMSYLEQRVNLNRLAISSALKDLMTKIENHADLEVNLFVEDSLNDLSHVLPRILELDWSDGRFRRSAVNTSQKVLHKMLGD